MDPVAEMSPQTAGLYSGCRSPSGDWSRSWLLLYATRAVPNLRYLESIIPDEARVLSVRGGGACVFCGLPKPNPSSYIAGRFMLAPKASL